nr:bifunctional glutamate N-acetyltransferase/amino-acid acetyltransferase ArgJ [Salsuginibacillus halophilus]
MIQKVDESITAPAGFFADGLHTSVKRRRKDLGVIFCEHPAAAAAVYTTNAVQAAPLFVTKEAIQTNGTLQAFIVNSGNANACTGEQGQRDAYTMQAAAAEKLGLSVEDVGVASTGVIGETMPMDKILPGIELLNPERSTEKAHAFNEAILTTDKIQKHTCYEAVIDGAVVKLAGVAKGSGMIKPNMATMLAFLTTDAVIDEAALHDALKEVTDQTYNRITVDGDTSTNDMVAVMASGAAHNNKLTPNHPEWSVFTGMLKAVSEDLSKRIAQDGEGATKLIEVQVEGAQDDEEAGKAAKAVVGSDLVKTMAYGNDANWGRVICALGYSGAALTVESVDISIGSINVLKQGQPQPFSEEEATTYLKNETVVIHVHLHQGPGSGKAWGCDLTYDYVRINAGYRT